MCGVLIFLSRIFVGLGITVAPHATPTSACDLIAKTFMTVHGSKKSNQGPCGPLIDYKGEVCYEVREDKPTSFSGSIAACKKKYGRLAMFHGDDRRRFLSKFLVLQEKDESYYIGMDDLDNDKVWRWMDSAKVPLKRPPWRPGQPDGYKGGADDEVCGSFQREGDPEYGYNDVPCELNYFFICQYDPWVYLNW